MNPKLVRDLILPDYGDWSSGSIYDPLHPIHGPLPDLVQIWRWNEYEFKAAIWALESALIAMVELILEESDPLAPLLPISQVHAVKGWVPQTYRWKVDKRSVSCFDARVEFPTTTDEEAWIHQLCETVLKESVRFATQRRS